MKTNTAIAAHGAVGLVQAGAMAVPGLPWWAQLLIQVGLMIGQAFLAKRNSESDPQGNPLPAVPAGKEAQ